MRMRDPGKICTKVFYLRKLRIHRFDDQVVSGTNSHSFGRVPATTTPVRQNGLRWSETHEYLVHFVPLARLSSSFGSVNIALVQTSSWNSHCGKKASI